MLLCMNLGHEPFSKWALKSICPGIREHILDIGCGGGCNIQKMLSLVPGGHVSGVDYSPLRVENSRRLNAGAIAQNMAEIIQGSVSQLPYKTESFDIVTAFETIYYWPDIINDLREVHRDLKRGGKFFICNEVVRNDAHPEQYRYFIDAIGMNVYTGQQLATLLEEAGFINIKVIRHAKKTVYVSSDNIGVDMARNETKVWNRFLGTYDAFTYVEAYMMNGQNN